MKKIIGAFLISVFTLTATAKDVVVLVPGFFNAFAPEYFSKDIIQSFQKKGFSVYVIEGLNPIGTIEDNGAKLIPQLEQIKKNETGKINIVAHSAGGFYSLYAIQNGTVEINNLVTVSTPYLGLDFIQAWRDNSFLFSELTNLCSLDGLTQLTPEFTAKFLKTVRVPEKLKIFTYGGWQPRSLDIWNAKNLSGVLRITDHFIPGDSDGIVSFKSSLGIRGLLTTTNKSAQMFVDSKFTIPLEHWEQVLDYRSFLLLGTRNISVVQERQINFYSKIADLVRN
jgi:hypothetical protein